MQSLRLFILVLFLIPIGLQAQYKFKLKRLNSPSSYGKELEATLPTKEVYEFDTTQKGMALVPNDLRSSRYIREENWLDIKDDVELIRVDLVFSKYPIRHGKYSMNHPLLCNRIKKLLQIDPELNDPNLEWRLVLQTHCENDEQVDSLYHGAVIYYRGLETEEEVSLETVSTPSEKDANPLPVLEQDRSKQLYDLVDEAENNPELPEAVQQELKGKSLEEKNEVLEKYYQNRLSATPAEPKESLSPKKVRTYRDDLKNFQMLYGQNTNKSVTSTFDRHPEWDQVLVVADWTGSMYGYGAQVLDWHLAHLENSGIEHLVLFNDGDQKSTADKEIGSTGGIYSEEANSVKRMFNLYRLVMSKGGGGDGPENDIEAILEGMKRFPESKEIVLIADNYACVRDMQLMDQIDRPVHVILCGYDSIMGANPQYLELAYRTGGSLHTLSQDIVQFDATRDADGEIQRLDHPNIQVALPFCLPNGRQARRRRGRSSIQHTFTSLAEVKASGTKYVVHLELIDKGYDKFPKQALKYNDLNTLDLSKNKLSSLPGGMKRYQFIRTLNLNNNELTEIPEKASEPWRYLTHLNISNNHFSELSPNLAQKQYLQYLNIANNEIQQLPAQLNMRKLKYLYASYNELRELPKLNRVRRLEEMDLSHNELQSIPPSIKSLKKLKVLDLSHNQITFLPKELEFLQQLKVLNLKGNPISEAEVEKWRKKLPTTQIRY